MGAKSSDSNLRKLLKAIVKHHKECPDCAVEMELFMLQSDVSENWECPKCHRLIQVPRTV